MLGAGEGLVNFGARSWGKSIVWFALGENLAWEGLGEGVS